jgi:hypothetical protein
VNGEESFVLLAKEAIEIIVKDAESNRTITRSIPLPSSAFVLFLNNKGEVAKSIEQNTGAKIDFDRSSEKCIVKGRY